MITRVSMTNWRAYEQQAFDFKPGINFLMGANGQGKTSVLEAIAYALTGAASTVDDPDRLARDSGKPVSVELTFSLNGQTYTLTRTHAPSGKRGASPVKLAQAGQAKALATTAKNVKASVEELMGVSIDFLQRIIYMAEGDVFRFLDTPPGEAIDRQIRQVLGLTQMDEFLAAMGAAEKDLNARIKTLTALLKDMEKSNLRDGEAFQLQLSELEQRRTELMKSVAQTQSESSTLTVEQETVARLKPAAEAALRALESEPTRGNLRAVSVLTAVERLDREHQQHLAQIQEHRLQQARLSGEKSASERILNLLLPLEGSVETLPCPVCHKPMSADERANLLSTVRGEIEKLEAIAQQIDRQLQTAEKQLASVLAYLEPVRQMRNELVHGRSSTLPVETPLGQLAFGLNQRQTTITQRLKQLEQVREDFNQRMRDSDNEKVELLALRKRLEALGYQSPVEASEMLVGLETRALSLRAAQTAAQAALTAQRDDDLKEVYRQVASAWTSFLGDDQWSVSLDTEGSPVLKDRTGREFDLSQFSGGEKTAMLIMLHTIIAHYFSRSDFLMIDEPLEHLDAINRRSLIYFLLNAFKRGAYQQAIIATFEESLIRKYLSDSSVNVIHV